MTEIEHGPRIVIRPSKELSDRFRKVAAELNMTGNALAIHALRSGIETVKEKLLPTKQTTAQ